MEKHHKFNIYYLVLAIFGVLVLQDLIFSQFRPQVVPYSEFIRALDQDRVIEISVGEKAIRGRIAGQEHGKEILFNTVRVDTDLSNKLTAHNVRFSGLEWRPLFSRRSFHGWRPFFSFIWSGFS